MSPRSSLVVHGRVTLSLVAIGHVRFPVIGFPKAVMVNLRVILVRLTILAVIQLFGLFLGVMLRLLTVDRVQTFRLEQLVDLSTSNAGDKLFGKPVAHRLA